MDDRTRSVSLARPAMTLGFRLVGFGVVQLICAVFIAEASRFWLVSAALTNVATLLWLQRSTSAERLPLRTVWLADQRAWKKDLGLFAATLAVGGPFAFFPMQWLSLALWGDANAGARLMFTAAPAWVAFGAGALFVLTQPFAELPAYCGYALPRLRSALGSRWAAVALVAAALSLQHLTLPFLLDWRFLIWRALMYLPFAALVAIAIDRRPSLLPYFMGVHFLMDAQLPLMVWWVTTGQMTM